MINITASVGTLVTYTRDCPPCAGAFGYLSKINSKGDTGGNFSLIVCKQTRDSYEMFPVGNFRLSFDSDDIPVRARHAFCCLLLREKM